MSIGLRVPRLRAVRLSWCLFWAPWPRTPRARNGKSTAPLRGDTLRGLARGMDLLGDTLRGLARAEDDAAAELFGCKATVPLDEARPLCQHLPVFEVWP